MDSISQLRTKLISTLRGRASLHAEQELFDELATHKSRLLNVFDAGPKNAKQKQEIESGKATINGKKLAINADFAKQVIYLSTFLDCSEHYVAGILHDVMSENPNVSSEEALEAALAAFHQTRRHIANCLQYLLEAAEVTTDGISLYRRLGSFVRGELITGPEPSLAAKILKEIKGIETLLASTFNARQNAKSRTTIADNQTRALGYDILNARYDSLKYERRTLALALCSLCRSGFASSNDIQIIVDWISDNPHHPMMYFILVALFATLNSVDPSSFGGQARRSLACDKNLMTYMTKKLGIATDWKDPGLKAIILLKWTLFLTDSRRRDSTLEHREGFKTEELETQIWNAVQGGAFSYLILAVYQLQGKRISLPPSTFPHSLSLSPEQDAMRDLPPEDFRFIIFTAFESLIRSLITHAFSELRKIKQRQEDLVLANSRPRAVKNTTSQKPRNDIAILYSLVGTLFHALPEERALQFWGSVPSKENGIGTYQVYEESQLGKLPAFLQWAVWSTQPHDIDMFMALYDMLAGLAKGQHCSELAYNFMARGGGEIIPGSSLPAAASAGSTLSWATVFNMLESWASQSASPRPQVPAVGSSGFGFSNSAMQQQAQQIPTQQVMIGPKDVLLAQSCLCLLSTVVTHSSVVRIAICGNTQFRAIPTLVSLLPLGIPLELKGSLFETLAAFCEPGAGVPGVEICKAVWLLMERLEVINVRAGQASGAGFGSLRPVKGVEIELEDVESVHKLYPATIPFLKLLSTLIHTPKRIPLKEIVTDCEPINTIPESLGVPYRLPGAGPFVSFVIDNVFSKIASREYARPSDRWETNDLCLCFIERALASFDLEGLVILADQQKLREETFIPLLIHPGYDVMKRLLTNTPLQSTILSYIVDGIEGFEKEFADEEPFFRSTIIRVLRIVHRVLQIQDIFLDVLLPLISDYRDSASVIGTIQPRSYYTRFDQSLSFGPRYVPALAAYITFRSHSELALLSVNILSILAFSPAFSNLIALIEQSEDSERILSGFRDIISVDSLEDVAASEALADQVTGAGATSVDVASESLEQAMRLAVLDFFLKATQSGRSFPNVGHYLLFGSSQLSQIQDPHALGAQQRCIHIILDLINAGVPRLTTPAREDWQAAPLFETLPELAERCYKLIYQLSVHPRTSDFTMRYLRTREDFFARQLAVIPAFVPPSMDETFIEVQYGDGSRFTTTVPALCAFLRLRSWIFDLIALELHILTTKGLHKGVTQLLEILFGYESSASYPADPMLEWGDQALQPFREAGQSHMRIIEFIQSLKFDWSDDLAVSVIDLQLFGQLNLLSCVRTDSFGCEVVDRNAVISLLVNAKRALHSQGSVPTPAHLEQLNTEMAYILQSCAVENHRREVGHAVALGYKSWRQMLDMALMKCFNRLPQNRRETMLFDLLHVLPSCIRSPDIHDSTAIILSEAVLSCITKLREDRHYQIVIHSAYGDADAGALPAERLHTILRSVLECILEKSRIELVRGNLYATLISFMHLIYSPESDAIAKLDSSVSGSKILALSVSDSRSSPGGQNSSSLVSGTLSLIKAVAERLVTTISRDAIDGAEVWKTIAFMLLDALVQVSRTEKQHVILTSLVRHGILSNFVRELKESDVRLQSVLKPDPDDLNPLYVYESRMSLLIRLAQTRAGAERLLEAQVLPILSQCDFLDARPESDQAFIDNDTFLPSAIHRYHQLLMPALQLINALQATLGQKHATVANQVIEFFASHRDTIVIFLKTESEYVSLSLIEEVHLLVTLCGSVLAYVPKGELASSNSDFGSIHAAILAASARYISTGQFTEDIEPQTDAENQDAQTRASGYNSTSKFEIHVRRMERHLHKAFVSYIGNASDFTEPEISPILSPNTTTLRTGTDDKSSSRYLATLPSIGDTIEALNSVYTDLSSTIKQISDLSASLSAKDHDHLTEMIIHESDLQDLDMAQKRSLTCREFERIREDMMLEAKVLMGTVEMLFLVLWRHLAYYADPPSTTASSTSSLSASRFKTSMMSALSTAANKDHQGRRDPQDLLIKSEVGRKLGPVLGRIGSTDVDYEQLGEEWRGSRGYVEIMCRRLRDVVGLHDADEEGGST